MNNTKLAVLVGVIVLGVVGLMLFFDQQQPVTTTDEYDAVNLDAFATCIADSGATFYGAYWCSHCRAQKEAFGDSAELLPYVECSTPDGKGQTQVCADAGITGYPTWVFADGRTESGEQPLADLASYTGCELPVQGE